MADWKLENESRMGQNDTDIQYEIYHKGAWVCSVYFGALGTKDPLYLRKVEALEDIATQMLNSLRERTAIYPWETLEKTEDRQDA